MIKRVDKHTPLEFDEDYVRDHIHGDAAGTHYESRAALYFVSRALPYQRVLGGRDDWVRRFIQRANEPEPGNVFVNEMIHRSTLDRFGTTAPFQNGGAETNLTYEPENLRAARGTLPVVAYDGEVIGQEAVAATVGGEFVGGDKVGRDKGVGEAASAGPRLPGGPVGPVPD